MSDTHNLHGRARLGMPLRPEGSGAAREGGGTENAGEGNPHGVGRGDGAKKESAGATAATGRGAPSTSESA